MENEQAALVVPARLLARIHPHFREVLQLLAMQAADEARHMEVFTRRALLHGAEMGTSSVGGRASLTTLLAEPDFSLASFLLSVLGEGSSLPCSPSSSDHAPDPITRQITRLARQDEARHVAFGMAHLEHQAALDPTLRAGCARRSSAATMRSSTRPASTRTCSTRWSFSPPGSGRRRRSPAATAPSRRYNWTWTTGRRHG